MEGHDERGGLRIFNKTLNKEDSKQSWTRETKELYNHIYTKFQELFEKLSNHPNFAHLSCDKNVKKCG